MNIVEFLNSKKLTISCAESFTGGAFANTVTNISHSSSCFLGGIVCYDPSVKIEILGVEKEIIIKHGTVSKECCEDMVKKCLKLFNSDIAVSFTGNAGPTAIENKPVGTCFVGIAYKDKCLIKELHLEGSREDIKKQAIDIVINTIEEIF